MMFQRERRNFLSIVKPHQKFAHINFLSADQTHKLKHFERYGEALRLSIRQDEDYVEGDTTCADKPGIPGHRSEPDTATSSYANQGRLPTESNKRYDLEPIGIQNTANLV